MVEAARLHLRFPDVAVVDEAGLGEQNLVLAASLPGRPVVLGGCCCAHVGAIEGLAARHRQLAVVWFDAHGDLNTPASSPSGNEWGMPFRMLLDGGAISIERCALIGARNLDAPEVEFIERSGLATAEARLESVLEGADAVYVAFDADVLEPGEAEMFMPEPNGLTLAGADALLHEIVERVPLAGIGFTGLAPAPDNTAVLERLCLAAGL
jgi:arginase